MGNGMNKVLPGLYLGSFRDGKDIEQLRANNITHIVSIHDTAKVVAEDKQYLCIRVPDSPEENLTKYFARCNDFIHSARMGGGGVLIHCLAGVSRSATIAAAYIMSVTSLNCKDALKVIRGARNIANPNYGFHSQLKEFETYALTSERKRLKIRYSAFDNQKKDEEECAKMITVYHANLPSTLNPPQTQKQGSKSTPSLSSFSLNTSSPTHKRHFSSSVPSSSQSTPTHKHYFSSASSSAHSTPSHKHYSSSVPSSSHSTPTHKHNKPSTPASNKPSPSASNKPSPSESNKPSPSASNKPLPSESNKPSPSASNKPSPSESNKPSTSASNKTATSTSNKPSISASNSPLSSPVHRLKNNLYRSASGRAKRNK